MQLLVAIGVLSGEETVRPAPELSACSPATVSTARRRDCASATKSQGVLLELRPERLMQLYVDFETEPEGVWTIVDHTRRSIILQLPF